MWRCVNEKTLTGDLRNQSRPSHPAALRQKLVFFTAGIISPLALKLRRAKRLTLKHSPCWAN
jgi:hypothetical protein